MRNKWPFPGSKWYKFDFHTHTPASNDYCQNNITAEEWLKKAMQSGLDCVVITDHNSGRWIDILKRKNNELYSCADKPDWYRELIIFPGVEITVTNSSNRIHLLAVFDPNYDSQNVTGVLGACGITTGYGDAQNTSTNISFVQVVQEIQKAGGIAIPAHIDGKAGLLHGVKNWNLEIEKSLKNISAVEICDLSNIEKLDDHLKKLFDHLAKLAGSDAHTTDNIGKYFSWIKMSNPSIHSLRLALLDNKFCIKNQFDDPNCLPDIFLSKLTIKDMCHCGRISNQPFDITFHPYFNAIIGGRGSGKSTVIESIRIATRRDQKLFIEAPRIKEELDRFMQLKQNNGVMLPTTELLLEIYRRGIKYRLRWRHDAQGAVLEEDTNGIFQETATGNIEERFPISIFSQKQINELASNPRGLLEIIDRSPEVNRIEWQKRWDIAKSQFLQLRERERELLRQLNGAQQLRTKLHDIENDLRQYEEKGHAYVLKQYQKHYQQFNSIPSNQFFDDLSSRIRILASNTILSDFPSHLFDDQDETTGELKQIHDRTVEKLQKSCEALKLIADNIDEIKNQRNYEIKSSKWMQIFNESIKAYNNLVKEYKEKNSKFSISLYGEWVQLRNNILYQLKNLDNINNERNNTQKQINNTFNELYNLRIELYEKRKKFINKVIGNNKYVHMSLVLFGDVSTLEKDYRSLLGLEENKFISSIYDQENEQGILWEFSKWEENKKNEIDLYQLIHHIKEKTFNIAYGGICEYHHTFSGRLKQLFQDKPYIFDQFEVWFPEDMIRVQYSKDSHSGRFEDLEKGSAGQKAAAILAFLLSHGNEPLVIDQPEDDLDNSLIYDLIVKQIHENKSRRQIIIATHNPNIVVNGDAEIIHILKYDRGLIKISHQGGLDKLDIQKLICDIMEGGTQAFKMRYNRIMLEE